MRIEVPMLPKAGLRCRARSKLAPPTPCRSRRFETSPPAPSCRYGEIGRGRFRPVRTVPRRSRPTGAQAAVRGWSCAGSMAGREGLLHPARIRASSSRNISTCCCAAMRGAQAAQARPIASRNRRGDQPGLANGRSLWTRATVATAPASSILSPSIRSASSKHHGALVHSDSVKACQGD
jgi:hypothetical protein